MATSKYKIITYEIRAHYHVKGTADLNDIVSAIHHQTESCLRAELGLDLNDMIRTGLIAGLEVEMTPENNETEGFVTIPVYNQGIDERITHSYITVAIAAAIKKVTHIGPYGCEFLISSINDMAGMRKNQFANDMKQVAEEFGISCISKQP